MCPTIDRLTEPSGTARTWNSIDPSGRGALAGERYRHSRGLWVRAMVHGFELVDAVFSRSMLAGLRRRVEAAGGPVDVRTIPPTGRKSPTLAVR